MSEPSLTVKSQMPMVNLESPLPEKLESVKLEWTVQSEMPRVKWESRPPAKLESVNV